MRRHQLDAGEPRAACRGRRLYAAFSLDIWPKDLGIVLRRRAGGRLLGPADGGGTAAVPCRLRHGAGPRDDAAVAKVYARNAGLHLPGEGG